METRELQNELFNRSDKIVKNYRTDMLVDHDQIAQYPGVPFLHMARESGTHIFMLHNADSEFWPSKYEEVPYLFGRANRHRIANGVIESVDYLTKEHRADGVWTYYNGDTLETITWVQAIAIAYEWKTLLFAKWRFTK